MQWLPHLPILPILIPLFTSGILLLLKDSRRKVRLALSFASMFVQLIVAANLLGITLGTQPGQWPIGVAVYLLGDWPAPFGIVLVVDRLAAMMVMLNTVVGGAALIYAVTRWERSGVHFLPFAHFLFMGLNGAFLTGDLFNLFVFFEVLLVASYALMLHGSGEERVTAGMHYIVVNLIASFLLLIAIALIYAVTGTLNFADLAVKAGQLQGGDRRLFESAAAVLSAAFLIKAAAWPLNFWLPATYATSSPPSAAMFAIMTKLGVYCLLRMGSLLLPSGAPAAFGGEWMFAVGLATLVFGTIGVLATQKAPRLAGFAVILSSGILLTSLGVPGVTLTGPALYYLIVSVIALATFYLLLELIERSRSFGADLLAVSMEAFDLDDPEPTDDTDDVVGMAIPGAMAFLGMAYICCALLITGMPPLAGFVGKFTLMTAALQTSATDTPTTAIWLLIAAILVSGVACLYAFLRTGIRLFWSSEETVTPRLQVTEAIPVAGLILIAVALTIWAGPILGYLNQTALWLDQPQAYIDAVLSHNPVRELTTSRGTP